MRLIHVALTAFVIAVLAGCRSPDSSGRPDGQSTRTGPGPAKKGGRSQQPGSTDAGDAATTAIVLPTSGRVHKVNQGLRFVVIDYTLGGMPPLDSILSVYRAGEKVGEVRLSGPERNGFVAADIVEGFLQVEDEVRIH